MRCIVFASVLLAGSSIAAAEPVSLSDIAGKNFEASINSVLDLRWGGRSFSNDQHTNWKISVEADAIQMEAVTTSTGPKGTRKGRVRTGRFVLGESRGVRSRGGGQGEWSFEDSTLRFVRTFPSGAYRLNFVLARSDGKITCAVTEAYAREGTKPIVIESPFGGETTIINSKQLPSTCQIKSR